MSEKIKYRTNTLPMDHSEEVTMYDLQAQYVQNSDTWAEDSEGVQTLDIRTYSVQGSTEGEYFFTISTDRWAFNDIDELVRTIQEFKNRIDGN